MNMRHLSSSLTAAALLFWSAAAPAQTVSPVQTSPAQASPARTSPAEQRIAAANRAIAASPDKADGYNTLALALARRARETSDTAYYVKAEAAIAKSLELMPDNYEALKMRVWVLLGKHEFKQALDLATALNKRAPDDLLVYGFLTDANVELGRYAEAEEACQWMLDLRPGNIPAFTRAAYLRELFGDVDGALELMAAAYQRTPPLEVEDRAWILSQIGHLEWVAGRIDRAEHALTEALVLMPDYHYALANLARVRTSQKRFSDAVDLLTRRYQAAPHAENLYALGQALAAAGQTAEAGRAFADFEAKALKESALWDNANRELIFYYADHAGKPMEARRIAELEVSRRQDVYTLDAYAWALKAEGKIDEARAQIDKALLIGVKDPEVLARAAIIGTRP